LRGGKKPLYYILSFSLPSPPSPPPSSFASYLGIRLTHIHLDGDVVLPALIIDGHRAMQHQQLALHAVVVNELLHLGDEGADLRRGERGGGA
jgi:hypothetical protein